MSNEPIHYYDELHSKLDKAEKNAKELISLAKTATEKAKAQAKAEFAKLEQRSKDRHAKVKDAEVKAQKWLDEKKIATSEKIASWKAQHESKRLAAYAQLAEDYATASIAVAASAIDEAERAILESIHARIEAQDAKETAK